MSEQFATESMNNIQSTQNNHNVGFGNMNGIVQMKIMSTIQNKLGQLSTGNEMIDLIFMTMFQCMMVSLMTYFVTKISSVPSVIFKYFNRFNIFSKYYLYVAFEFIVSKILCIRRTKYIKRYVDVPYISDTKEINHLYKAVFWYLTHDDKINYNKEPYIQFFYNHKLSRDNNDAVLNDLNIHKILSQNIKKTIKYKQYEITYWLTTENITVYAEKDRTRENYKVELTTIVPDNLDHDILEEFCQLCVTEYMKSLSGTTWKQLIYTNNNIEWKSTPSHNSRKLETIILKNGLREEIKNDLELFLRSEEWYKDRDIPYTRGYLFYGLPGTGKTSMIKGIATYAKRHVHYLMLANVKSDADLIELLKNIKYNETILVIEDIDATLEIVKSRDTDSPKSNDPKSDDIKQIMLDLIDNKDPNKKIQEKSKLTLSGILNAIDGIFSSHGRILIMTTNHPEVLDNALIRPGRIDRKYLFDNCDVDQIKKLFVAFFNKETNADVKHIQSNKYSPAHVSSIFLRYRDTPDVVFEHLDDTEMQINEF